MDGACRVRSPHLVLKKDVNVPGVPVLGAVLKGLELANQGGAKVKVKDIEVLETRLLSSEENMLNIEARWNVSGSVGHWGHVHKRTNAYHAKVTIKDIDGRWKLNGLEILQEERL